MNTSIAIIAVLSAAALLSCISAEGKTPDFSGTWVLDVSKSKLDESDRIESLTLTVTQSAKEIRVASALKLIPYNPAFMGGPLVRPLEQNIVNTYTLDGKENKGEVASPVGPQAAKLTAQVEGQKLVLWQKDYGDPAMTSKEVWILSADSKTLTIDRTGLLGRSSTMVFKKK